MAALGALVAVEAATVLVGSIAVKLSWQQSLDKYVLTNTALGIAFAICGAVIAWTVPRNAVGWLFLVCGVGHLGTPSLSFAAWAAAKAGVPEPLPAWLATIGSQAWGLGVVGLFGVALLLFPDGRLPARGWSVVVWLIVAMMVGETVTGVLSPGPLLPFGHPRLSSPIALAAPLPEWILDLFNDGSSLASLAAIASLVVRYIRGDERIRRQLQWLVLALILILVINAQRLVTGDGPILFLLTFVLVPVAIAIAIVRYGLLDIRLALSRALLYGVLLALVTALFAGIVAGLSLVLPVDSRRGTSIVAAIIVAIAFAPLRSLLLRTIGRALYGRRADPTGVASRLGDELAGPTDSLEGALGLVRQELRIPYLAIRDRQDASLVESGTAPDHFATLPLPGSEGMGLAVGLRRGETALHPVDRRALALLASPIAIARRALALSEVVAEARTEVVTERERERQRLQRELHDGLGPRLTGIAFRLDAAANVAGRDPLRTIQLLAEARSDLGHAIDTVRDVVQDLRPIELDQSGLVAALRARIAEIAGTAPMSIRFLPANTLPATSAAVEVAIYRVALEAVTNAVRHSNGSECEINLHGDGTAILLLVEDDGEMPRAWQAGVGISSMRHRAVEVGGTLEAGPGTHGWSVSACFPAG